MDRQLDRGRLRLINAESELVVSSTSFSTNKGLDAACRQIIPDSPCNKAEKPHIGINKEICLRPDHGCTGRCVEADQEGRCEFRPAFFFARSPRLPHPVGYAHCLGLQILIVEESASIARSCPRLSNLIAILAGCAPGAQPTLKPSFLPVSLANCNNRPSSRSPTKASQDRGTLRTISTSPSEATAGTNSSCGTMPGIDAEKR